MHVTTPSPKSPASILTLESGDIIFPLPDASVTIYKPTYLSAEDGYLNLRRREKLRPQTRVDFAAGWRKEVTYADVGVLGRIHG
jgi:hypothetical protein